MPERPTRRHRRARTGVAACLVLLACWAVAPAARAEGTAKPAGKFAEVVAAWSGRSSEGVAKAMEAKATVSFRLLAYPLSGKTRSMKPEQARATLKEYFKRIGGVSLKDVTPKRSPASVRIYDYTYKPVGESKRTTRLHVQLKQDGKRQWVLASVSESRR